MAPAAFLANIIDTLPIIRNIFQNQEIEMADVPGTKECWHELHHTLNEDKPPLPEQVKEILKQAKLDQTIQPPAPETSIEEFLEMARPPAEKAQHFLHSVVQQKRLRQSLTPAAHPEDDPTQEPAARATLRRLALLRGEATPTTGSTPSPQKPSA